MNVILIQEVEDGETTTIGVASSVKSAGKLIDEYYGDNVVEEIEFNDIRDSNLEYSKTLRVNGLYDEYVVQVVLEWFEIDSL
jgi:uncharacterized protein YcnI